MSDLDEKVDKLEAAVDPNVVISIGGYSFTPAKLMIAGGIVSSVLGGLYGAFTFYKDYMDMKVQIQEYVAPDLSGINERISKLEERMQGTEKASNETLEYVRDIRNGLQSDIRELAKTVDANDRRGRELDRDVRGLANGLEKDVNSRLRSVEKENDTNLKALEKKVEEKIQKAWENPLAK
jgi:uncharacterized protein YoxC